MFPVSPPRIWLYTRPADMRKQYDGLAALAQGQLREQASSGDWFVFINRRRTHLKVLYYHQGGYCLWSKRLERGTFHQVKSDGAKQLLNGAQLQCLIDGIYWQSERQNRRHKTPKSLE